MLVKEQRRIDELKTLSSDILSIIVAPKSNSKLFLSRQKETNLPRRQLPVSFGESGRRQGCVAPIVLRLACHDPHPKDFISVRFIRFDSLSSSPFPKCFYILSPSF